jgi:heptosyltransferase-1
MGDVIHNLPIIADIHAEVPHALIDWVVEENFADMLRLNTHIQNVIPVAIRRWRKHLFSQKTWQEIKEFKTQIQAKQYDYIIDTQTLLKSALIACLANGKRYGQGPNTSREWLAGLFNQRRFSVSRDQHAVDQNRQLTAMALNYRAPTNAPNYGLPRTDLIKKTDVALPEKYVMVFHATSRDSKLWPTGHWVSLGLLLAKQGVTLCLPWVNETEKSRANIIASHVPKALVLPKSIITELAHITAGAQAAVGVDTGLIHLAVSMNVPSIAIYTDTHPDLNGTYGGTDALAINLGGKGRLPEPSEVFSAFDRLGTF